MSTPQLDKTYSPHEVENRWYQRWVDAGLFHAEPSDSGEPYTIVIPPPNVTGSLHVGHALNNTLQDILIRWRRMQGCKALWMPGTDHAESPLKTWSSGNSKRKARRGRHSGEGNS